MKARVLGSAAGGGFPQWNCACPNCIGARTGGLPVRARTQASLAVGAGSGRWYLVNATPDIGAHLNALAGGGTEVRRSPVAAVLLTDAELDHASGLLQMREGTPLAVYATEAILAAAAPLLDILAAYKPVERVALAPGSDTPLDASLTCRALATGSLKRPRYAAGLPPDPAGVVGYRFTDADSGRSLVYMPCVPALTEPLVAELKTADCAFVDGTCFTDDEMAIVGLAGKTSRSMGHAPVTGEGGTLPVLAGLPTPRRVYTHLNNTNPLLVEDSAARAQVEAAGIEVAYDGMEVEPG